MSSPVLLRRLALLVTFSASLLVAQGATWVLANGDRLTGNLVRETDGAVEIEHPQLGRLTIARAALQGSVTETAKAPASRPAEGSGGGATPTASTSTRTRPQWARKIEFGFVMQEGAKSQRDLTARGEVEGRLGAHSLRGTARVVRSESQGVLTKSREEADFRWRRDFNRRTFAQALTTYGSDDLRNIDYTVEQQLGGGYRILDGARQKMNLGVGAVLQRQSRKGYEDETALLGSAFQDYAFSWNNRFKLTQESSVQYADDAPAILRGSTTPATAPTDGNYRFRFNTTLESKMTDQVSLNLRYEYDYDHSIPERALRSDSRLTTSLGYAW
jgi:putative salt-induced outer membrane protein YdiY